MFAFKFLSDGVDLGFRSFRLSNIPKNLKNIANAGVSVVKTGAAIVTTMFATRVAVVDAAAVTPPADPNLCAASPPSIFADEKTAKTQQFHYQTSTGSSYAMAIANVEPMWKQAMVNGEINVLKKVMGEKDQSDLLAVADLKKWVALAAKNTNLPVLTDVIKQLVAPITIAGLRELMAKQAMQLPISFDALIQTARDVIPQTCNAVLGSVRDGIYHNVTGALATPIFRDSYLPNPCNLTAFSLLEGDAQDINFERCATDKLQEAINPFAFTFVSSTIGSSGVLKFGGGVLVIMALMFWKSLRDIQQVFKEIRAQQALDRISHPFDDRLKAIKYEDTIPDNFICPISQLIMSDPVKAEDGKIYDRCSIQAWFANPNSKQKPPYYWGLDSDPHTRLTALPTLKTTIEQFVVDKEAKAKSALDSKAAGPKPKVS